MKCLVVSDSHGDRDIVVRLLETYRNQVDAIFHCGDSELSDDDPLLKDMYIVQGNMDFDTHMPIEVQTTVDDVTVYMTHGHVFGVNMGLDHLLANATAAHARLAFFGHTHQLGVERREGVLVLNPGSITFPRGEFARIGGTYAIVTTSSTAIDVQYYNRRMQAVPELKFHFEN